MNYISQPAGDRRCGAYAFAYWKWKDDEENGRPYILTEAEADNYVQSIYNNIVFNANDLNYMRGLGVPGVNVDELIGFSAPSKICVNLNSSGISREYGTEAIIYTAQNSIFNLLGKIGTITKIDKINDLKSGEKAILLVSNNAIPRHYIFAYGSNDLNAYGQVIMHVIDPADGIDVDTDANLSNWIGYRKKGINYDFLNTVIKFGHNIP